MLLLHLQRRECWNWRPSAERCIAACNGEGIDGRETGKLETVTRKGLLQFIEKEG